MRIDRRLLGWGAFFLIAGAVPIAVRGGALPRDVVEGWPSLWPLLLIGGGLGLVLRGTPLHLLGGTLTALTAGVMAGGLLAVGLAGVPAFGACGTGSGATAFADQTGTIPNGGSMDIQFNCGTLRVGTVDGSAWTLSGSGPAGRQPQVVEDANGVRILPPLANADIFHNSTSTWQIGVPHALIGTLNVTLNAGEGTVNLAGATVVTTNLTVNAGSLDATLADAAAASRVEATVNAGSAVIALPDGLERADFSLNAGSMTVCVPAEAQVRIGWRGGLASNNFAGLGLARLGGDRWATSGLDATSPATDIEISANAGSFTLVIGGSCHA
jgi:hypothetical protein